MIFFTSLSTQYQIDLERPPILKISHRLQSWTIIGDILIAENVYLICLAIVRIIHMVKHPYPNAIQGLYQNNTYITYH